MYSVMLSPYSRLFYVEWKLDQSRYDYNVVFDQRLEGKINITKLDNAIQRFVNDYVILNSHIEEKKENLYWAKNDKVQGLKYFKEKLTNEKIFAYLCQPFDLEKGALYRFALIKLGKEEYRFIAVLHHIIIDGLSFDYFINELSCYYNDWNYKSNINIEEQLFNMSELSQQLWEYVTLNKEKSSFFWKGQLANMEPLELSFLKINSTINSSLDDPQDLQKNAEFSKNELNSIGEIRFDFHDEILIKLEQLRSKYNVTSYLYCQSIYALLLHLYSGQDRFCINYPVAIKEGMSFIYGSQININIIPYDFSQIKNVLDLIKKSQLFIKSLKSDAIDHSYLPSLDIASVSNKSIFELPCSKTNLKNKKFEFDNIKINKNANTEIDLSSELFFEQQIQEDIIHFRMRYRSNIISSELINEFIACYKRLFFEALDQLLESKDVSKLPHLGSYRILSQKQLEEIVKTWNQTDKPYPHTKTVPQLFEEQAFKTPDAIAVIKENQSLSYRELNKRSNQLAFYLRERGVGQTTRVGIALQKSFEMIIGFLGVLKAGAAYVPLDPTYPKERLQFMIEDSNVPIILTDMQTIDKLPATWAQVVCLDEEWTHIKTLPENNLENFILPDHLAYIIYTSGSTGKPKGVAITHRSLIASSWARMLYYSDFPLNIPIFSSISFDITTGLIFWCMLQGGSLFIPPEDIQQRPIELIRYMKEHKVTHITFVPSIYILLLQYKEFSEFAHLKLVFLGGEECPKHLVLKHIECLPNVPLYNEYGPTENTVWTTVDQLYNAASKAEKEYISIGKPRLNTKVYILDKYLNPTPIGVAGEVYIAGSGLAEGYLNQPDLTAEKFIPNPFVIDENRESKYLRLYCTGDIARYLPGGDIEFKARVDEQVKIRGFRVELGEVESIIKSQGNIAQAIVIARGDGAGDKKLIAYIVPEDVELSSFDILSTHITSSGFSFSVLSQENLFNIQEDLRKKLALFLPEYMIPSFFVYLNKFPLNPNGKLDRNALPEPGISIEEQQYVGPRTELESKMCEIWGEVLEINQDKLGIRDNFFRLGGNSVLAIKLSSKINEEFKSHINVSEIFKHNTIEALVHYLKDEIDINKDIEIPVIGGSGTQVLSFAQERLWFVEKYEEGSNAYNIFMVFGLAHDVKLDLIERSIKSIISRHEILRTLIKEDNEGKGYQLVCDEEEHPFVISKVEVIDYLHLDEALEKQVNHVFDLANEYPIKVCLYGLNNPNQDGTEFYIGIVIHHIAFDGWSVDILVRELQSYYSYYLNESQGLTSILNLPNLSIQYKDFAVWQRQYLNDERIDKQLNYWKNKLENYENLNLMTDKARPIQIDYKGRDISFELDEETSIALRELAKELKVSLYSLLLSGYYLLLKAYSNQEDIVIGTPVANRHYSQVENLIGFFVNSLALRIQVDLKDSVKAFVQKVGQEVIEAQLYQDLPFEKLVEELKVPKDPSRHPIFQVMFAVHDFGGELYQADGGESTSNTSKVLQPYTPTKSLYNIAKFDISTLIDDSQTCLKGGVNYATSLYNEETIHRFIGTYIEILKQFAELAYNNQKQAEIRLSQIAYMNEKEYKKIIYRWNQTDESYSSHKTIHSLFEEQVEKTPDNLAVTYEDQTLTYRELNEKSNQLAHYLCKLGIRPETPVAISFERSVELVIGLLAIWKTGGTYVPLDLSYPDERLQFILKDTKAPVLISGSQYKERFSNYVGIFINLTENKKIDQELKTNPSSMVNPQNLAYLMYTSGSTGIPKGVGNTHQGLVNRMVWTLAAYPITKQDSLLQIAAVGFDISVWEMMFPLLGGGHLFIGATEESKDPKYLIDTINKNKISIIHFVPSLLNAFLDDHLSQTCLSLKQVVCGGEALSAKLKRKFFKTLNAELHHAYGPTEAAISVTHWNCRDEGDPERVPIGRPISNIKTYVLNDYLTPVPIGAVGELYLGGDGLARGYFNRPALTSEKFIANPFQTAAERAQNENERLYKTGDLVRWLSDGNLEYIGRDDFQVKIRGYRIELGEIEAALLSYEGIKDCVVLSLVRENTEREARFQNKYLVGYYVSTAPLDEKILLNYLSNRLPEYMVPSMLVFLKALPLTPNGKLDKRALPNPEVLREDNYIAPRNELESQICQILAEVLNLKKHKVGIHDDFFRLGGDSIVTIQFVNKLRQRLGLVITVKDIFKYKSIERLYDNVLSQKPEKNDIDSMGIKTEQGILSGEVALLPIQAYFFENNFQEINHYNQSFMIRTPRLDLDKLQLSLKTLVEHHDSFRLRYEENFLEGQNTKQTYYKQYYDPTAKFPELKTLDITTLGIKEDTEEFELKLDEILTSWQNDFDLKEGPIFRMGYLYGYSDGSARLYFALHHLIIDTVSWRIILEDLKNLYEGKELGHKGSSYRQWANAIKAYKEHHKDEKDYWIKILTDYNSHSNSLNNLVTSYSHMNISKFYLDVELTNKILRESNKTYNTEVKDLLLTALGYTLFQITNNSVNHIMLEGHGREEVDPTIDITRTIGWFTTLYPVRLEIGDRLDKSIKSIKENLRKIPNKGIGYGALMGYKINALPKISFNYLGQFDTENNERSRNFWNITNEKSGMAVHPANQDHNIINVSGMIINGSFQFIISSKLSGNKIAQIQKSFSQKLQEIVDHTINQSRSYLTLSDINNGALR